MSHDPSAKRPRIDQVASPNGQMPDYRACIGQVIASLPHILQQQRQALQLTDLKEIEIEIRIGMLIQGPRRLHARDHLRRAMAVDPSLKTTCGAEFKAGIDETLAHKLRARLVELGFVGTKEPPQTLFVTEQGERFVKSSAGYVGVDKKERLWLQDLGLSSHDYDLRVCMARETKALPQQPCASLPAHVERRKRRTSFVHGGQKMWRVDLTEVSSPALSSSSSSSVQREVELEFELQGEVVAQLLTLPLSERLLGEVVGQLLGLLDLSLPSLPETDPSPLLRPVADKALERALEGVTASLQGGEGGGEGRGGEGRGGEGRGGGLGRRFVGAMPVNLFRRNLSLLHEGEYFATEKTDGTRYLLYLLPHYPPGRGSAVLMDRARALLTFEGGEALARALGGGGGGEGEESATVLDGELVFNLSLRRSIFMVFDLLMYKGERMAAKRFSERMSRIRDTVFPTYHATFPAHGSNNSATPLSAPPSVSPTLSLPLMRKKFVKLLDLSLLLKHIVETGGERVYRDGEGRHHQTDGLILQPDAPYVFSKHYELMKWKWADLRSVDLIVQMVGEREVKLLCEGGGEKLINCSMRGERNVGIGRFDTYRLLAEKPPYLPPGRHLIAEVSYDPSVGLWAYQKLRPDKAEPNFIDSVLGVFIEQAEGISREELEYSILAASKGLDNDYDEQLGKMRKKLMDWQRSRK